MSDDFWAQARARHNKYVVTEFSNHLDDLEVAVNRLRHATSDDRIHHPATPAEIRRCLDDLADTIERMRG